MEVKGKLRELRRGFIYLDPDDNKLIDKNEDILEFDINSEFIKDKVEEIIDVKDVVLLKKTQ